MVAGTGSLSLAPPGIRQYVSVRSLGKYGLYGFAAIVVGWGVIIDCSKGYSGFRPELPSHIVR